MDDSLKLGFRRYTSETVTEIFDSVVRPLYVATHVDVAGTDFYGEDRFVERLRGHAKAPGFEAVIALMGDRGVGQAYGYSLPRGARWWKFLTTSVAEDLIWEDGRRTFALCELMVHPDAQRQGIARELHNNILSFRPESRATLLVREDNTAAQVAYAKWGWRKIGKLQPFSDSPNFDALILELVHLRSEEVAG